MRRAKRLFFILLPVTILLGGLVLAASAENYLSLKVNGCPCVDLKTADGQFVPEEVAYFEGRKVTPLLAMLPELAIDTKRVLGDSTGGEKWIEVDLSDQSLKAWEGDRLFLETPISSGKSWTPTIKGEFRVQSKFQYAKMSGGVKGTSSYYYLPNVPYIMFFQGDYSLHGTYWHNNFGHPMSHGCVNLPTVQAEKLFYWTTPTVSQGQRTALASADNPGTRIVIHD